ncbi:Sorbitol dehydrogenase [Araneus ventricosus]|uniref:Sorbitol dehydrogenase n=1 Tax=Araneus ventricosus TaxID=182803 RepID=A0A4Y2VY57_ARAVE|nr:Sorbitol dehydrogenase [Araneus ventricosus]
MTLTDIAESRLEVAKKIGATNQLNVKDMDPKTAMTQIISKLGGCPDITLECSGAESSVRLAIFITKSGGVVMCVGLGSPEMKIPIIEASVREVDIKGVFRYHNCFPIALELVSSGAIDVKPLISHHFSLEEIQKAFETVTSSTSGAIKVLIHSSN